MPMNRAKYPPDWSDIAGRIKAVCEWKCQSCGKQCRRPGEEFTTHRVTLTVAHINHVTTDNRQENLIALCAPCHLRYDGMRRRMERLAKQRSGKSQ